MKKTNPFVNSDTNKRYYTFDCFLKRKFGGKVIKIPLDGGFTCPNIDGTKGVGGCIYCSKSPLPGRGSSLEDQFARQRAILLKKWGREDVKEQYIQYFQVFTNTYGSVDRLKTLYNEALSLRDTVGLSVATRADCLADETVALLRELHDRTYLTVELGLQTVHDETAGLINRGHTYEEFLDAYRRLDGLNICVHLINGLPGEDKGMMLETARRIAELRPHAVKLHMLYVEQNTALYDMWLEGKVPMLELEEYVDIVCSQLELFHPDTVIERITGDGEAGVLVAPMWSKKKFVVMNEIDKELIRRDSFQGRLFGESQR